MLELQGWSILDARGQNLNTVDGRVQRLSTVESINKTECCRGEPNRCD